MSTPTIFLIHGYNGIPPIFNYFKTELEQRGHPVVIPMFPTQTDITESGYFEVFDRYQSSLGSNTIAIAHSVGNIMLMKYLCTHNIHLRGYISLAGFGEPFTSEGRDDLNSILAPLSLTPEDLTKIPKLVGTAHSIYSDNDHIVPFELLQSYPATIGARPHLISNIGHMGSKSGLTELPEVIDIIGSMSS